MVDLLQFFGKKSSKPITREPIPQPKLKRNLWEHTDGFGMTAHTLKSGYAESSVYKFNNPYKKKK